MTNLSDIETAAILQEARSWVEMSARCLGRIEDGIFRIGLGEEDRANSLMHCHHVLDYMERVKSLLIQLTPLSQGAD